MPYLTFATIPNDYRSHPGAEDVARSQLRQRHERLSDAYSGNALHQSQSLDQFYYHSLPDTTSRDHDQVVTRYIENIEGTLTENDIKTRGKRMYHQRKKHQWGHYLTILRVDQLWMWVVDEGMFTSSSH
jgi:hypothetical protein